MFGLMKDELDRKVMTKFVGIRPKPIHTRQMIAMVIKKAKGTNNYTINQNKSL